MVLVPVSGSVTSPKLPGEDFMVSVAKAPIGW